MLPTYTINKFVNIPTSALIKLLFNYCQKKNTCLQHTVIYKSLEYFYLNSRFYAFYFSLQNINRISILRDYYIVPTKQSALSCSSESWNIFTVQNYLIYHFVRIFPTEL